MTRLTAMNFKISTTTTTANLKDFFQEKEWDGMAPHGRRL
jgi:hypothetical protein